MKLIRFFRQHRTGLQLRMTLWVTGTVSVVAILVMLIATSVLRREYEEEVRLDLEEDIEHSTKFFDQRMRRMEYITTTAASLLEGLIENTPCDQLERMVAKLLAETEAIDAVSLALVQPGDTVATLYSVYREYYKPVPDVTVLPAVRKCLDDDLNWIHSYQQEEEFWCAPFIPEDFPDDKLYCFSVPIHASDGTCRGMFCTMILEQWVVKIIQDYKTRPDIDVTIYNGQGDMLVTPDDYILALSSDELLVEERVLDRLDWHLVYSSDRHVVTTRLSHLVGQMVVILAVLLACMVIAIILSIKYVAKPFMEKQQLTAQAKAALERELQIAAKTQGQLVPHKFPPFPQRPEISLHACLNPAREVGGDLYDYFVKQDILYFCIGDVSGKGVPAALFMAATHYLFRSVASAMPMTEAVRQMNLSLCTDNEQCNFVTFFFGEIDLSSGKLEYCNAGHNSPILIHEGDAQYFAASESTPLGIWEEAEYPSHSMQLAKGDTLLLYTDGVTEAKNANNEELGEESTLQCVTDCQPKEPVTLIERLMQRIKQHAGDYPQSDDITLLSIKINK